MQSARQDVVDMLRRTGFPELAEEALRVLPDPVDLDFAAEVLQSAGLRNRATESMTCRAIGSAGPVLAATQVAG
jgi:hypothetical protein